MYVGVSVCDSPFIQDYSTISTAVKLQSTLQHFMINDFSIKTTKMPPSIPHFMVQSNKII